MSTPGDKYSNVVAGMRSLEHNGSVIASYEEIASASRASRRTVARAIDHFCRNKLVHRIHAKGRGITNIYWSSPRIVDSV